MVVILACTFSFLQQVLCGHTNKIKAITLSMKKSLLLFILLSCSACIGSDYHSVMMNQSMTVSKQNEHLRYLQAEKAREETKKEITCYHYPSAAGSYSYGCY